MRDRTRDDFAEFQRNRIADARRHDAQQARPKLTDGEQSRPGDCTPNSYCEDMNAGRPCACFPAQQLPEGFMEAFYEMAAILGIESAQAKSPEQVYREQVKPALERLQQRATDAEAAYLNMRQWAEQNGLDTTARNAGVSELGHQVVRTAGTDEGKPTP